MGATAWEIAKGAARFDNHPRTHGVRVKRTWCMLVGRASVPITPWRASVLCAGAGLPHPFMTTGRRYVLITPCRDEAKYARRTLDSVAAQTVRPALWVIVDDGSTD